MRSRDAPTVVAVLLHFPPRERVVGGREIRTYHTLTGLLRLGAASEVVAVTLEAGGGGGVVDGVRVVRPRASAGRLLGLLLYPAAVLAAVLGARLRGRPVVLYIPWPPGLGSPLLDAAAVVLVTLLAALGAARLWVNIHDPLLEQYLHSSRPRSPPASARLLAFLEPHLLKRARYVTAASESLARRAAPPAGGRVGVYYAGVDPGLAARGPRWPRGGGRLVVGYTGSPYDENLDLVVGALGVLEGRGCAAEFRVYVWRARGAPVPRGVRVVEGVAYRDLPRVAGEADVLVVPRRRNPLYAGTLPNKLPLYMASGRPVVATRLPETQAYLAHAERACPGAASVVRLADPAPGGVAEALWDACRGAWPPPPPGLYGCLSSKLSWLSSLERALRGAGYEWAG